MRLTASRRMRSGFVVIRSRAVAVFKPRLALALVALALPLSLGLQRLLRGRYEPAVLGGVTTSESG